MRTLKFRAWDKENKRMLWTGFHDRNWYLTERNDEKGCHCLGEKKQGDANKFEIMQFTGLKDKNLKEIYEGDVVKHDELVGIYEVIFKNGKFLLSDNTFLNINLWNLSEIIGNIYENPELLK
jgi:uncharacterized phage protein (TIGR01671 family)